MVNIRTVRIFNVVIHDVDVKNTLCAFDMVGAFVFVILGVF